jgi:hypothetical protein
MAACFTPSVPVKCKCNCPAPHPGVRKRFTHRNFNPTEASNEVNSNKRAMSGRGVSIIVKVLGGATGNGETEELSLPVALHSPLQVLKEQLEDIVGIPSQDQVLILCDLTDPDRNSDVLLNGRDFLTLRQCQIKSGSTLTLHALGVSAEKKQQMTRDALAKKEASDLDEKPRQILATPITAAEANHR